MLKANLGDLRVEYCHVTNISPYPMVTLLDPETGLHAKLKISTTLYNAYRRKYRITWFTEEKPHRFALLYYKEQLVDLQPAPLFEGVSDRAALDYELDLDQVREEWVSPMEANLADLQSKGNWLTNRLEDVYFDGLYLFSIPKNGKTLTAVDDTGTFFVSPVRAYNVTSLKESEFFRTYTKKTGAVSHYPRYIKRMVLAYKCGAITEVSPTVPIETSKQRKGPRIELSEKDATWLNRVNAEYRVNLDFVMVAAKVVRELYGYRALSFIGLHEILTKLKVSTLKNLDSPVRRMTPVHLDLRSVVAWLLGFLHQEKDYVRMMRLVKTFNFLFTKGLLQQKQNSAEEVAAFVRQHLELPLMNAEELKQKESVEAYDFYLNRRNRAERLA